MRGDARLSRGQEWRHYACPVSEGRGGRLDDDGNLVACHAKRVRANEAERFVVDALSEFLLPPAEVAAARDELRMRLQAPKLGVADEQRARLSTRLENSAICIHVANSPRPTTGSGSHAGQGAGVGGAAR